MQPNGSPESGLFDREPSQNQTPMESLYRGYTRLPLPGSTVYVPAKYPESVFGRSTGQLTGLPDKGYLPPEGPATSSTTAAHMGGRLNVALGYSTNGLVDGPATREEPKPTVMAATRKRYPSSGALGGSGTVGGFTGGGGGTGGLQERTSSHHRGFSGGSVGGGGAELVPGLHMDGLVGGTVTGGSGTGVGGGGGGVLGGTGTGCTAGTGKTETTTKRFPKKSAKFFTESVIGKMQMKGAQAECESALTTKGMTTITDVYRVPAVPGAAFRRANEQAHEQLRRNRDAQTRLPNSGGKFETQRVTGTKYNLTTLRGTSMNASSDGVVGQVHDYARRNIPGYCGFMPSKKAETVFEVPPTSAQPSPPPCLQVEAPSTSAQASPPPCVQAETPSNSV
uniref:Uncharacterized protein n=1 Tax=Chromera velia CCMP2878 TaxID=1169474 RepID=A0A0G4FNS1_9ALVE|eukprot:Cvel_17960.t1-p1 / transcript=Cvel_17960.t1 / gene=Cvel_17960 / organism=Chromera_velia_CCMP2878 / gene_product=hypothetical protein / transcript_product=hypothetical protein / location=Cvel_scaffold1461:21089-28204(+) / protein_length=393 / sequence_SO=supercontig / SO=protein_coding / is_pseudo=false